MSGSGWAVSACALSIIVIVLVAGNPASIFGEQASLTYTYTIDKVGATYRVLDSAGSPIFADLSSNSIFDSLVGVLTPGDSVYVSDAAYVVDDTWLNTVSNVSFTFGSSAVLTLANAVGAPIFYLQNVDGCTITGGTFDANRLNQVANCQAIWLVNCTNCLVDSVIITNARTFGFCVQGTSSNCGIINSTVSYCAWNGISLAFDDSCTDLYAIGNTVSHCADVGIDTYGTDTIIKDNTVFDMEDIGLDDHVGSGAMWGIACEDGGGSGGGNYLLIGGNTVSNCNAGIVVSGSNPIDTVVVSDNILTDADLIGVYAAVYIDGCSSSIVEFNSITTASICVNIRDAACNGNTVYGNGFSGYTIDILDNGTGTIYTAPATQTVATSASSGGSVSPSGTQGYCLGRVIEHTATASSGYYFNHWVRNGVSLDDTSPYPLYVDDDVTLQAVFTALPSATYTLTTSTSGAGTVSPYGATVLSVGVTQQVTASPTAGNHLDHWALDSVSVGTVNPYSVTMNADHTLQAVFAADPAPASNYTVTVSSDVGGATYPAAGVYTVTDLDSLLVFASASSGYRFSGFTVDGVTYSSEQDGYRVTINGANRILHASFSTAIVGLLGENFAKTEQMDWGDSYWNRGLWEDGMWEHDTPFIKLRMRLESASLSGIVLSGLPYTLPFVLP